MVKQSKQCRAAYYSLLMEENENSPRFLSSTVVRTKSHNSVELCIPIALSNNDVMSLIIKLKLLQTKFATSKISIAMQMTPSYVYQCSQKKPIS